MSEDAAPSVSGVASRIEAINRALQRGRYRVEASALAREQADGLYRSATEFLGERVALAASFQERDRPRAAMAAPRATRREPRGRASQASQPPARGRPGREARADLPAPRAREARRSWGQPDATRATGELLFFPHFAMIT